MKEGINLLFLLLLSLLSNTLVTAQQLPLCLGYDMVQVTQANGQCPVAPSQVKMVKIESGSWTKSDMTPFVDWQFSNDTDGLIIQAKCVIQDKDQSACTNGSIPEQGETFMSVLSVSNFYDTDVPPFPYCYEVRKLLHSCIRFNIFRETNCMLCSLHLTKKFKFSQYKHHRYFIIGFR